MVGSAQKNSMVIWLTGLPASGKTTLAYAFAEKHGVSYKIKVLDGDELRKQHPNLGFSKKDRLTQSEMTATLAAELEKSGHLTIVALVSPYAVSREIARSKCKRFFEVYLSTPLEVCVSRDPKGLYKKAYNREISHFTGVSDPYEVPSSPDLSIDTSLFNVEECVDKIYQLISQ